jgi:uncharacterized coiled-coil DUF342 family protein
MKVAEPVTDKGAPIWLTVLALLIGSGGATVALVQALANRGKNKAETTKTIIDGLSNTLTTYNDSLLKANERVMQANERADRAETKLERIEKENEELDKKLQAQNRELSDMRERMVDLEHRIALCEQNHGQLHQG